MALQDSINQLQNLDLADLDFNNVGSWPGPVKVISMLLLLVIIVAAGYYLYIKDKSVMLEQAVGQEQAYRAEYEDKQAQAANLDAYLKQKEEMRETFGALLRQLPSDTEVPGLLEDITRTAIDSELKIESIDLRDEVRSEFYVELPIDIVVEGEYHKIGSFVSAIANLPRIVTLHDFVIEPKGSPQKLRMTILAKTYRYLQEGQ
ncbi:MAG: type 4a pilus biogenesis protein PilO [Pseudomonadales bacterium]|nr:type 4a pilus biogenesis protein PilO [Pseudomonadales bacterium]